MRLLLSPLFNQSLASSTIFVDVVPESFVFLVEIILLSVSHFVREARFKIADEILDFMGRRKQVPLR